MDISTILLILQIITGLVLISLVLIQTKGSGLGRTFGGGGSTSFKRRGLESLIFKLTFVVTALFIFISILQVVV